MGKAAVTGDSGRTVTSSSSKSDNDFVVHRPPSLEDSSGTQISSSPP